MPKVQCPSVLGSPQSYLEPRQEMVQATQSGHICRFALFKTGIPTLVYQTQARSSRALQAGKLFQLWSFGAP